MFKRMKNIVSVVITFIRFFLIKLIRNKEFYYEAVERFSPGTMINIHKGGYLKLGRRVRAHTGTKLSVTKKGSLIIGEDTAFNYNFFIVARRNIKIGAGVIFGPNVVVYDHDHDFRSVNGIIEGKYLTAPIKIGNNVWIGANCIILRGTEIGNDCVVGAGTLLKGKYGDGQIIYQKREVVTRKRYFDSEE